jgi:hypothetical protein
MGNRALAGNWHHAGPAWHHTGVWHHAGPAWHHAGPAWHHAGPAWHHAGPAWHHAGPAWHHAGPAWHHAGPAWHHAGPAWHHGGPWLNGGPGFWNDTPWNNWIDTPWIDTPWNDATWNDSVQPVTCDTDRTLNRIPMQNRGAGAYGSGPISFTPVPYNCLEPGRFIVVRFDHAFNTAPSGHLSWEVKVTDSSGNVSNNSLSDENPRRSGRNEYILNVDISSSSATDQSAFTTTAKDPSYLIINVSGAAGTTTLNITNVQIRFNNPG